MRGDLIRQGRRRAGAGDVRVCVSVVALGPRRGVTSSIERRSERTAGDARVGRAVDHARLGDCDWLMRWKAG